MLTIKSRLFKTRQGEYYTVEDLEKLCKVLVTSDCVNFKCGTNISYGYNDSIAQEIIGKLTVKKTDLIVVINDLSLHMYNALTNAGYTNVTLAYGTWEKNGTPSELNIVYNIMNDYIKNNFKEEINVIKLKEIFGMKIDGIIANPPYGRIGSEITKAIVTNIDFKEMINLLPTKDYKILELYKYVTENYGKVVWGNLDDAKTLPDICKLGKITNAYSTFIQYEINSIYDKRLTKFWQEQLIRKPTIIEQVDTPTEDSLYKYTSKNSFCVGVYTAVNLVNDLKKSVDYFKEHPDINKYINEDSWRAQNKIIKKQGDPHVGYIWNICRPDCAITDVFNLSKGSGDKKVLSQIVTLFETEEEKINFTNWWYSAELSGKPARSGLASILVSLMHKPCHCKFDLAIPRVNWHKAWTDEEILKDYNFNDDEIKTILAIGDTTAKHRHTYGDSTFN